MERSCIENWALDDILKTHSTALKASDLMRFARLPNKLRSSREQSAAIENLSPSLVEELVHGPIAETIARIQEPSELAASGETLHGRRVEVAGGAVASAL